MPKRSDVREELGPVEDWIPSMKQIVSAWVHKNPYFHRDEAISEGFVILWQAYLDFDTERATADKFPVFLRYRLNNRLHDFMRKHHCISKAGVVQKKARTRHYIVETPSELDIDMGSVDFEDDLVSEMYGGEIAKILSARMDPKLFEALIASTERSGQKELAQSWGLTEGAVSHIAKKAKSKARAILNEVGIT